MIIMILPMNGNGDNICNYVDLKRHSKPFQMINQASNPGQENIKSLKKKTPVN